jgi:general secretion pathway protein G
MVRFSRLLGALIVLVAAPAVGRPVEDVPAVAKEAPEETRPFMRRVEEPGRSMALEIASRTFVHSSPGAPRIVLVGVSHIGERGLYADLQDLLDGQGVVLYESVKPPGAGGPGGADDGERVESTRAAMRFLAAVLAFHHDATQRYPDDLNELAAFAAASDPRMGRWLANARADAWSGAVAYRLEADGRRFVLTSFGADRRPGGDGVAADMQVTSTDEVEPLSQGADDNLQAELARALGLQFQLDALDYDRPHFRNSDMAMDQLERALEAKDLDFAPIEGSLTGSSLPGRLAILILRLVRFADDFFFEGAIADGCKVVLIDLFSDEALIEQSLLQFGRGFTDVIIGGRNQVVVEDVKAILANEPGVESIAILYGAAHMPDMARRLHEQLGYRPAGEQWFTAFDVNLAGSKLSPRQLAGLRAMIRQQLRQLPRPPAEANE